MIKVGDRVKFLNDVGGGVVTGFIGKNMVNVENEDGFEIPYPVSQLVNISAPGMNAEKKEQKSEKTEPERKIQAKEVEVKGRIIEGKNSADFYFCMVPVVSNNPVGGDIELFLANDSNFTVLYHYSHFSNGKNYSVKHGTVVANSRILLESLGQHNLNEVPEFGFQLMYFQNEENDWHEPIQKRFKINPLKFYKETSFQQNRFFEKNAMILQIAGNILKTEIDKLSEEDFKKVVKSKQEEQEQKFQVKKKPQEIVEVDLHINELIDNAYGLSNIEMLQLQRERVETEMRSAIQAGVKKIVFIHGVGQGVLKKEISDLLKSRFPKYSFHDASFQEYGYGATMVILRK